MGAYLGFTRYKYSDDYIIATSNLYDFVEVDFDKITDYKVEEGVFFKSGIRTLQYQIPFAQVYESGLFWEPTDYLFYTLAINPETELSIHCLEDGRMVAALFKPGNIVKVISCIVELFDETKEAVFEGVSDYAEQELKLLKELLIKMQEAEKKNELILVMHG
jgi:hypothetical protein